MKNFRKNCVSVLVFPFAFLVLLPVVPASILYSSRSSSAGMAPSISSLESISSLPYSAASPLMNFSQRADNNLITELSISQKRERTLSFCWLTEWTTGMSTMKLITRATMERMQRMRDISSLSLLLSCSSVTYSVEDFNKPIWKSLNEFCIKKKTSSLASLKSLSCMLLIVKIVEDICRMLSVSEKLRFLLLFASSLKYKVTVLLFKS